MLAIALPLCAAVGPSPAGAVPAFAIQTGQPCAACHVGAFGPQLKPYGRDFKLHGYVASDGQDHGLPLAMTTQSSFTHTAESQPGGAAPGFRPNDNVAIDQVSLYYAGRITPEIGGFVQVTYDGVAQQPHIDNIDLRRAGEGELFGQDMVWGITVNDNPTVQDPWNSTPTWGFPCNRSPLAPTPMAATLVDGGLAQRVAGAGVYALWNDLIYVEADVYKGLDATALKAVGSLPLDGGDQTNGFAPYARLAVIKDWELHHVELGTYALAATGLALGANPAFGSNNRVLDTALDGTYQFIFEPAKATSDMLSAHATYIHENSSIEPNDPAAVYGLLRHALDTFRADVSYSIGATITPSIQYFRTTGTADANYWATPNGSPNSDGMIFEVAFVPFGKPNSPFPNFNLRLAVQYVDYFSFDGTSINARSNNNLYVSLWTAVAF